MKQLIAALCLALAVAPCAFAQEKSVRKEPTEKQKAQHARMKDCAAKAGDRGGDERKKFMRECLSKS